MSPCSVNIWLQQGVAYLPWDSRWGCVLRSGVSREMLLLSGWTLLQLRYGSKARRRIHASTREGYLRYFRDPFALLFLLTRI